MSHMEPVLLAFLLTLAAGGATGLGALIPFALRDANNNLVLGLCLGLSAGVMIYISFTEIYRESVEMFRNIKATENSPVLCATVAFFSGMLVCVFLDFIVHFMIPDDNLHLEPSADILTDKDTSPHKPLKRKAKSVAKKRIAQQTSSVSSSADNLVQDESERNAASLAKMSILSALAIALHNLPEGIATFFATLSDPKLGASLAVAIAIHNIPEGIAVALPVYYATKSKLKSFLIGFASGLTEPLGGLIAYYILKWTSSTSDDVTESVGFAFMFALVAGMMIYISIAEL
eukprot:NODE_84_length_22349_cov_0.357888.p9 type:complete len:289 gc:universal NODE_84_length_22349_cov_0.357888:17941-17075(-)